MKTAKKPAKPQPIPRPGQLWRMDSRDMVVSQVESGAFGFVYVWAESHHTNHLRRVRIRKSRLRVNGRCLGFVRARPRGRGKPA